MTFPLDQCVFFLFEMITLKLIVIYNYYYRFQLPNDNYRVVSLRTERSENY